MFWLAWGIGSALNVAVVSVPLWFVRGETGMLGSPRALAALAVLHCWVGCDLSIPAKSAAHYRDVRVHHRESRWFPHVCGLLVLGAVWLSVLDYALHPEILWDARAIAIGGAVAGAGLGLRFWAVRALGSFFTEELKVLTFQPLVRSGPYRWIRHPSYTGLALILVGVALLLGSGWGMAYFGTVIVPMIVLRVTAEDRLLRDGFGSAFAAYRAATWRLIPAVY